MNSNQFAPPKPSLASYLFPHGVQLFILLIILGLLALAIACGGGGGPASTPTGSPTPSATPTPGRQITIGPGAPILIGVSTALSGAAAQFGQDIRDAAILGAQDFGPVKGRQAQVVAEDEASDAGCPDADRAIAAANSFVANPSIVGVIGPTCFSAEAAATCEENSLLRISPASTLSTLTEQGHRFIFRTAWRDDSQARVQADYALNVLEINGAFLVDDSELYGESLAQKFEEAYRAAGGSIRDRAKIALGDTEFSTLVDNVIRSGVELLVFEGFVPEATFLLQQLRAGGFQGTFMGPDGIFLEEFVEEGGGATEGAVVTGSPPLPESVANAFQTTYGRAAATPFIGQAYDAVQILLSAIDIVAVEQADGSLTIDTGQLRDAVAAISFQGLTGTISFDEKGDRAGESAQELGLALWRVEGGAFIPVQ